MDHVYNHCISNAHLSAMHTKTYVLFVFHIFVYQLYNLPVYNTVNLTARTTGLNTEKEKNTLCLLLQRKINM